jgi:hypothetical protein
MLMLVLYGCFVFMCLFVYLYASFFTWLFGITALGIGKTKLFWLLDHILVTKWCAKGTIQ